MSYIFYYNIITVASFITLNVVALLLKASSKEQGLVICFLWAQ